MKAYDSIVIGGGILGCATACELAELGHKVLLIERHYLGSGSTGRCICGIRQQFSTPDSIRLAMASVRIFEGMGDVEWYPGGYLFLAYSDEEEAEYLRVIKIQQSLGLEVEYLGRSEVLRLIPMLKSDAVIGGTYCNRDGQANPFRVIRWYAEKIKKMGGIILTHTEVVKIKTIRGAVSSVVTTGGEFFAPIIVNAAGPWLNEVNRLADDNQTDLPVEAECHEAFITEATRPLFEPMIVSYMPSCYFQQLHYTGQIIGCYTPEYPIKGIHRGSTYGFMEELSCRMLKLLPVLGDLKVLRSWVGWYEMTPDGNPIIGETNIKGLWVIGGASGHGFMLGPALGRSVAELICKGKASIPVAEFLLTREFKGKERMG